MGTPTKLVEYLALGRPVVASNHPDQIEIIESSGAGLCTELTAEAFATSATVLLRDRLAAEEMGRRGPLWVRTNRSYEATTSRMLSIYEQILGHAILAPDGSEPPLGI
jgi:glycosyltransferase involved in cell wall biosynthesis